MIIKYYSGLQSLLCIITTVLLFWFTVPFFLSGPEIKPLTREDFRPPSAAPPPPAVSAMPKEDGPPISIGSANKLPELTAEPKPQLPPVVHVVKTWDDHVATVAHSLEILSPISSLFISIWLWRQKRKGTPPDRSLATFSTKEG